MQTEQVTAPGGYLARAKSTIAVDKAIALFKSRGYLKPKKVPSVTIYETMIIEDASSFFHIPKTRELKMSLVYDVSSSGSYRPKPVKHRGGASEFARFRKCPLRIAKLVAEETSKLIMGKNLWCAGVTVDLHYYLLFLSAVAPEKHAEICRADPIQIHAALGCREDEENFKISTELHKLHNSQLSKCLNAVECSQQRIKVSTMMSELSVDVRNIVERFLQHYDLENSTDDIREFFSVVTGMAKSHQRWESALSAVKRMKKFVEINADKYRRMGKDTADITLVDPMNYADDDAGVGDGLAKFGQFVAKQAGFDTEAQFLSLPSLGVAVFDPRAISKKIATDEVTQFKISMRILKGRQLSVDEVDRCLKLGWEFTDDRRLVHPRRLCGGFATIPCSNLDDFFTNTHEGMQQLVKISEGRCKMVHRPTKVVRTQTEDPISAADIQRMHDENHENMDLMLTKQPAINAIADQNRLERQAAVLAEKLAFCVIRLIYDQLNVGYLRESRTKRGSPVLPTVERIRNHICKKTDEIWPKTDLGVQIREQLQAKPKYREAIGKCKPIQMLGNIVADAVFASINKLVSDVLNPYVVIVAEEYQLAIHEMEQDGTPVSAALVKFGAILESYDKLRHDVPANAQRLYSDYVKLADFNFRVGFRDSSIVQSSGMTQATNITDGGIELHRNLEDLLHRFTGDGMSTTPKFSMYSKQETDDGLKFILTNALTIEIPVARSRVKSLMLEARGKLTTIESSAGDMCVWQPFTYICLRLFPFMITYLSTRIINVLDSLETAADRRMKLNVVGDSWKRDVSVLIDIIDVWRDIEKERAMNDKAKTMLNALPSCFKDQAVIKSKELEYDVKLISTLALLCANFCEPCLLNPDTYYTYKDGKYTAHQYDKRMWSLATCSTFARGMIIWSITSTVESHYLSMLSNNIQLSDWFKHSRELCPESANPRTGGTIKYGKGPEIKYPAFTSIFVEDNFGAIPALDALLQAISNDSAWAERRSKFEADLIKAHKADLMRPNK